MALWALNLWCHLDLTVVCVGAPWRLSRASAGCRRAAVCASSATREAPFGLRPRRCPRTSPSSWAPPATRSCSCARRRCSASWTSSWSGACPPGRCPSLAGSGRGGDGRTLGTPYGAPPPHRTGLGPAIRQQARRLARISGHSEVRPHCVSVRALSYAMSEPLTPQKNLSKCLLSALALTARGIFSGPGGGQESGKWKEVHSRTFFFVRVGLGMAWQTIHWSALLWMCGCMNNASA